MLAYSQIRPGITPSPTGITAGAMKRIKHYDSMTTDAIKAAPIGDFAAENCACFLWVTMPCLPDGIDVMRSWGFTYKTVAFTWVKLTRDGQPTTGLGHYTRANAELCFLGIHGHVARRDNSVSQVILGGSRGHSRKPDEQYERIMRLFDGRTLSCLRAKHGPNGRRGAMSDRSSLRSRLCLRNGGSQHERN